MNQKRSDLMATITWALENMKAEYGESFKPENVNLAELQRRTGISRKRLRKLKADGFQVRENKLKGTHKKVTVLTGYTALIDDELRKGNANSSSIKNILDDHGYHGGQTQIKEYIHAHRNLMPAKRILVAKQGNRGRRYTTLPGESLQMDWGFVNIERQDGIKYKAACFVMICHHCGERYVEFFPNAKQENLFIGMIHGFQRLGVPKYVLTDNMKSVVTKRGSDSHPIWNTDYEAFMKAVGFQTKLCKPVHPFTKGKVERLVQFVKNNFMAGRVFSELTDLNCEVLRWCDRQNGYYHRAMDLIPEEEHSKQCLPSMSKLVITDAVNQYLCPERKISFDGFINYEGRRFGVPYWYKGKIVRVSRDGYYLRIYSDDLSRKLTEHNITWSRKDSFCKDQYADEQPEEFPTQPVTTEMRQTTEPDSDLDDFNFDKEVEW